MATDLADRTGVRVVYLPRTDGGRELGSLWSPYWRARLVAPTTATLGDPCTG